MFTAPFWCLKRFKRYKMWRACGRQPHILGCAARDFGVSGGNNVCKCMCVCVPGLRRTYCARFPLGQSVAAMEHPGLALPSISRLPWLSTCTHTHTHTHSHKPLTTLSLEKTKAARYFIKRLQLLFTWSRSKLDFLSRTRSRQQVVPLRHLISLSYFAEKQSGGRTFSFSQVQMTLETDQCGL